MTRVPSTFALFGRSTAAGVTGSAAVADPVLALVSPATPMGPVFSGFGPDDT